MFFKKGWSQSQISSNVSDVGIFEQSTSASPYLQQQYPTSNILLPQEMRISEMQGSPARQFLKSKSLIKGEKLM